MATRVWTFNDCYISVYASDANGALPVSEAVPLLHFCYSQNGTVDGHAEFDRRERDCMNERELVTTADWDSFTASVDAIYVSRAIDLNAVDIFNIEKWLVVDFLYTASGQKTDEHHYLACCKASSFRETGSDNQNIIYTATFEATRFL